MPIVLSDVLIVLSQQTSAGAVVLTDVVFWCIIVPFLPIAHVRLNMVSFCSSLYGEPIR